MVSVQHLSLTSACEPLSQYEVHPVHCHHHHYQHRPPLGPPRSHPADPKLGRWVNTQRQCKKKLDGGHPNPRITAERVASLEAIGFEWVVLKRKR